MPRLTDPLEFDQIAAAQPKEKPYRLFDGGGLYVEVTPAGGKLWRYKYRFDGKEKVLSLGKFPSVSLDEARGKHSHAKGLLIGGFDPALAKSAIKALFRTTNGKSQPSESLKSKRLNKRDRLVVYSKFGGRCAYCGCWLKPDGFHVDHFNPIFRLMDWESGLGIKETGEVAYPERDTIDNLMPSCPPCNIDKHAMPLEAWRQKLQRSTEVLMRNNPTYRHALRFAQVCETRRPVVFYFEQVRI